MKYQSYPAYKASGVKWLGVVPEHWELTRVKFESYVKARVGWHGLKSDDFTDDGAYLITGQDFVGSNINWDNCYHCDFERYEQDPYIQLQEDDLLITKDGTIGKIALVKNLNGKATLNSGIFVVRPLTNSYTDKFYFWLLQSSVFTGFVDFNKSGSTIVHLYQDTFVNFKYAMPDFNEQQKIANFLDHETAKIDTLIEKQRRLIELLKEKRQAVISHAVTKGLNPNAPMKDSGVEWLGEVPEHWEVKQAKYIAHITRGAILRPVDAPEYFDEDGEWAYLNISDATVCDKYLYESKLRLSPLGSTKSARVYPDNVIITASATIGKAFINKVKVCVHDGFIPFCELKIDKSYLYHYLSNPFLYAAMGKSNTQKNIYLDEVKNMVVTVPPDDEQLRIVEYLESYSKTFDFLISKAESAIELMQERRTALISAAVTGKIDVRNWQAPPRKNWFDGYDATKDVDVLASLPVDEASEEW